MQSKKLYQDRNIGKIASSYKVLKLLGKGTFGSVYKCRNTETDEIFAVKIIRKSKLVDERHF